MEELKQLLLQTEDEYLIGISNRGILKRAYKDLETQSPGVEWLEEEVRVEFKDALCQLRFPLGDSSCSCPSRSICRHLIGAILYARQHGGEKDEGVKEGMEEQKERLKREILEISPKKLERFYGMKGYRLFLSHLKAGEFPKVEQGSVITIGFPWENTVVKLLSPLEYSTCSCHSRDLCIHKAQAILTLWLSEGKQSLEELLGMAETREKWDQQELAKTAMFIKEAIQQQMVIGLSRLSPQAQESMERLAVISRGARLPNFENEFRQAAFEYQMYRERKAAFRVRELMERLLRLYHHAGLLERTEEGLEIRRLAGSFRDTYEPVAELWLITIGQQFFNSKTGYEGEIYYFFEVKQKQFYTWTDARPTFYEGRKRSSTASYRSEAVPWGLNCSREELKQLEFYLKTAKVTQDNRLSVSQETRGEIVGRRELGDKGIETLVFWDYAQLLDAWEEKGNQPILVGAAKIGETDFDPIEQRFSMELLDEEGRVLLVAVRYTKEEKLTIQFLERLNKRLKEKNIGQIVFLGKPYLEKGQLCLYPIEYFMARELGIEGRREERRKEPKKRSESDDQRGAIRRVAAYLEEVSELLEDLFVCGLDSVQENLLYEIKTTAEEGERLGLHQLARRLDFLQKELEQKRHGGKPRMEQLLSLLAYLSAALKLCRKKTTYDLALVTMEKGC